MLEAMYHKASSIFFVAKSGYSKKIHHLTKKSANLLLIIVGMSGKIVPVMRTNCQHPLFLPQNERFDKQAP